MATFPGGIKSFSTKTDGPGQTIFAAHINDLQDEVVAVQSDLLTGVAHGLKPSIAGAQDLGTASLPWGITRTGGLQLTDATTLTLSADAVTVTKSYHAIDTEGAAATDNCATLTAGTGVAAGFVVVLRAADVTHVVTVKDGTGNLLLNGDYVLLTTDATLTLIYDGTNWREIARSVTATPWALLKANSGTSTAAGATNVDTIAITGLTAKDMLLVKVVAISVSQATANIGLYNSTDGVVMNTAVASLASAATMVVNFDVSQSQASGTSIVTYAKGKDSVPTLYDSLIVSSFTQNWTGTWTLALRHGGVTAGGTLQWRWTVLKIAGQ